MSRIYEKAWELYDVLLSNSKDGMFEGSLAGAYRLTGASQTYYTKLYECLVELGCIEILRKGRGAGLTSLVRLIRPPEADEFDNLYEKNPVVFAQPLTKLDRAATVSLEQRLTTLESMLQEGRLGEIDVGQALIDLENRLRKLELDG